MAEVLAHKAASLACEAGTAPLISAIAAATAAQELEEAADGGDSADDADSGAAADLSCSRLFSSDGSDSLSVSSRLSGAGSTTAGDGSIGDHHVHRLFDDAQGCCSRPAAFLTVPTAPPLQDSGLDTGRGSSLTRCLAMAVQAWDEITRWVTESRALIQSSQNDRPGNHQLSYSSIAGPQHLHQLPSRSPPGISIIRGLGDLQLHHLWQCCLVYLLDGPLV